MMNRYWLTVIVLAAYAAGGATVWIVVRHPKATAAAAPQTKPSAHLASVTQPAPVLPRLFTNSLGIKFVRVDPCEFLMGDAPTEGSEPQHKVKLTKAFMIATTKVTQSQWQAIAGFNPSRVKGDDHPVERVSWNNITGFCRMLSAKEGKNYRLPTEAEWECACRAGTTTKYSFGPDAALLPAYAWYLPNAGNTTRPVGQLKPNPWGLYDMHGNVWEWCSDGYSDAVSAVSVDPIGDPDASKRVIRGSSFGSEADTCRCAGRGQGDPDSLIIDVGFRLCLDPP